MAIISFGSTRALWKLRSCFDHVRLKEGRSIKKGILTTTAKPSVDLLTITNGEFGWKNYTVSVRIRIIQLRPMCDGRLYWVLGAGLILRKRKVLHSHYFLGSTGLEPTVSYRFRYHGKIRSQNFEGKPFK